MHTPHSHCLVSNLFCMTYLTPLSVYSPLSTPAICSWFSSAPPILCSGLASGRKGKDTLPHPVKLPVCFSYLSTCLKVDVLSTPASVFNKLAVILTYLCAPSCLMTEDQTVNLQHSRMSSILFDPAELLQFSRWLPFRGVCGGIYRVLSLSALD